MKKEQKVHNWSSVLRDLLIVLACLQCAIIVLVMENIKIYDAIAEQEQEQVPEGFVEAEHCLEWDNQYDRVTLMMLCVNFVNETLDCEWRVQEDYSLLVWTEEQPDGVLLPCTKMTRVWEADE